MEGRATSIYKKGWDDMDKPGWVYQPPDNRFYKPCTLDIATRHMTTNREAAARDLKRQNTVTAKSALEYYNNRHMEGRATSYMDKPGRVVYEPPDNRFYKPCTLDIATRHMLTHREAAARDLKRQNTVTANSALEYYNNRHSSRFELVDAVSSSGHLQSDGIWYHCNFKAKSEDSSTKLFFAEMKVIRSDENGTKYMVTSCRPLDGFPTSGSRGVSGCYMCSKNSEMIHPTRGFRKGLYALKRRSLRPRPRRLALVDFSDELRHLF